MSDASDNMAMPSDEHLVAFLDGELDAAQSEAVRQLSERHPRVAQRLAFLAEASLPFDAAFEPLLDDAPVGRLESMLDGIPPAAAKVPEPQFWSRRQVMAAGLVCLVSGVAIDRALLASRDHTAGDSEDWHSAVAEYLVLYTADTLNNAASDADAQAAQLRFTGERLGLALRPESLRLPEMSLKRAQLLDYEGTPLGQILYVHPRYGAFAFCIVASKAGERPMVSDRLHGLNVVHWSTPSHGFIVAGQNPPADLSILSEHLRSALV